LVLQVRFLYRSTFGCVESIYENLVVKIRFNMGNNKYDVEPFSTRPRPTIEPYQLCALDLFNKHILAI
jgi:hypothetical protein